MFEHVLKKDLENGANNSFRDEKKGSFTISSHSFDHQSKNYSYKVFTFIIEIMKHIHKKKKNKILCDSSETKEDRNGSERGGGNTNPRKFQQALYIIISRFTATRPRHCVHTLQPRFYVSTILQ